MPDKVRGGTRPSTRLCDTCTSSQIMRGEGNTEIILCQNGRCFTVPLRVVECSDYRDKRDKTPSLHMMQDMAFILTEQGPLKNIGFVPSRKWKAAHKDEAVLPNHDPFYDPFD